jgi:hypothetical protein
MASAAILIYRVSLNSKLTQGRCTSASPTTEGRSGVCPNANYDPSLGLNVKSWWSALQLGD